MVLRKVGRASSLSLWKQVVEHRQTPLEMPPQGRQAGCLSHFAMEPGSLLRYGCAAFGG